MDTAYDDLLMLDITELVRALASIEASVEGRLETEVQTGVDEMR